MRIVTLSVLVVAGGTLAALPFRRYQTVPNASSAPGQVTGPNQSVLDDVGADSQLAIDSLPQAPPPQPLGFMEPGTGHPAENAPQSRLPRQLDIPLTFADLAVPLRQPDPIKERFNATARVHNERREEALAQQLVMPSIEALAPSEVQQIREAASRFSVTPPLPDRRVTGSLAASSHAKLTADAVPQASEPDRERHWIRQPK